jgi:hypothetical protein
MENKITFAQQQEAWEKGAYALYPHCNDFYDWFCSDQALESRANKLKGHAKKLVAKLGLNPDKVYVFFKNNCPAFGPVYDSLSICDIEEGNVLCWATPKSGHTGRAELYLFGREGESEYEENTLSQILAKL